MAWGAGRFDFLKRRSGEAARAGRLGERTAERWLWARKGFRIIERNYSNAEGEIDLIAESHGVCVFVEVKARTRSEEGGFERDPLEAVDRRKRRNMRATARIYLDEFLPARFPHRFDLVAVDLEPDGRRASVRQHVVGALDPLVEEHVALGSPESLDAQRRLREALAEGLGTGKRPAE